MHRDIGAIAHGFHLLKDGSVWLAVGPEFVDLVRSPALGSDKGAPQRKGTLQFGDRKVPVRA
jgi:hypothetical protein